jgi:hypothetical protein
MEGRRLSLEKWIDPALIPAEKDLIKAIKRAAQAGLGRSFAA